MSTTHNLPIQKIEEIVYSQFKYVSEVIRKGDFDSIRLPYLGKFTANPKRIKYLNERAANNNRK
mgnify:FL=1